MRRVHRALWVGVVGLAMGCQGYDFIFQPRADREANHLRFVVETPSKADLLFVIDNSVSMFEEQTALAASIDVLLEELRRQDTRYRIGVTSTDALGFSTNCADAEEELVRRDFPGSRGDCSRFTGPDAIVLRRPHDGARGRLIAAWVPEIFDFTADDHFSAGALSAELRGVAALAMPTGPFTHPDDPAITDFGDFDGFKGEAGVRWVIERETIGLEACQACDCTLGDGLAKICDEAAPCYAACAQVIAPYMAEAYLRANIRGLGVGGQGWEQGLKAAAWAIGVDPEDPNPESALAPAVDETRVLASPPDYTLGGANTFVTRDELGVPGVRSWLRDEALFAVMFVSDEEDCSMPPELWTYHCAFEQGCQGWSPPPGWTAQPVGSLCYQDEARALLLDPTRIAGLTVQKKDGFLSRVAVGFIGGVAQQGSLRLGAPADCAVDPDTGAATTACSCLAAPWNLAEPTQAADCSAWCGFTLDADGQCFDPPPTDPPYCDALAGSRYVTFANQFRVNRRTYETVCRAETGGGFGAAMADFAKIATLACFELEGVEPIDPAFVVVRRAAREDAEAGLAPTVLPRRDGAANEPGWFYEEEPNGGVPRICLTGLDRLIGDVYDIFLVTRDELDYTR